MRDHQRGNAQLALQLAQLGAQVLANTGIKGRHRLVEQQQRRSRSQGPRQGYSLLLTTGKLTRVLFLAAGQTDQLQHLCHSLAHFLTTATRQAVGDVGLDRQVRKQRIGLKQDSVVTGLGWQIGDITVADI
ncbi:hypothetical protein D3C78_1446790 [compost metagenome]